VGESETLTYFVQTSQVGGLYLLDTVIRARYNRGLFSGIIAPKDLPFEPDDEGVFE